MRDRQGRSRYTTSAGSANSQAIQTAVLAAAALDDGSVNRRRLESCRAHRFTQLFAQADTPLHLLCRLRRGDLALQHVALDREVLVGMLLRECLVLDGVERLLPRSLGPLIGQRQCLGSGSAPATVEALILSAFWVSGLTMKSISSADLSGLPDLALIM